LATITSGGAPPPSQETESSNNQDERELSQTFVDIRQPTISQSKDLDVVFSWWVNQQRMLLCW